MVLEKEVFEAKNVILYKCIAFKAMVRRVRMKSKVYVIFGAGKAGLDLARIFLPQYIVDNDPAKWGTDYQGILICSPEQLMQENKEQVRILIASMYFPQIQSQLDALGFENHQHYWNIIPYYGYLDKQNLVDAIEAEVKEKALGERINSSSLVERMRSIFRMQNEMLRQQQSMRVLVAVDVASRDAVWVRHIIESLKDLFKLQVLVWVEDVPMPVDQMENFVSYYNRLGYTKKLYLSGSDANVEYLQEYFTCFHCTNIALSFLDKSKFVDVMYDITNKLGFNFKKVSVVVPNYNYENYLCKRLRSIIGQQYPIYEIIFLDDASSDDSIKLAKGLLTEYGGLTKIIVNEMNSGSVFKQWGKGIQLSQGDYLWIAEADDSASPFMLSQLMASFVEDEQVVLSFCDSMFVDEREEWQGFYSDAHVQYAHDSVFRGYFEGICDGRLFIEQYMKVRTSIPNVSAVVMKKSAMKVEYIDQLLLFKTCGDWYFYIAILMEGKVACNTMPMNFFNRHSGVITLNVDKYEYSKEVNIISQTLQSALNNNKW